jgi:hypothetical protein
MQLIATIIVVVLALGLAAAYFLAHEAFDKVIGRFFRGLGPQSGEGPLIIRAAAYEERLKLTLENRGKDNMKLAAVEGRDRHGQRLFPKPYLDEKGFRSGPATSLAQQFSRIVLGPSESRIVVLDLADLRAMDCRSLAVLDTSGRAWPVTEFAPDSQGVSLDVPAT